jgi:hypothetical protein
MKMKCMLLVAVVCAGAAAMAQEAVKPLVRGHSHNDYFRARPLLDALDHGLCSVEADIYLGDDGQQLLVGHDLKDLKPERTLQALYLNPLRERVRANGGRVYPGGPSVTLLIDIKSAGEPTYVRLREVLREYADILTSFTHESTTEGAVTVIISGSCPTGMVLAESPRLAAIDGRPEDIEANPPADQRIVAEHLFLEGLGGFPRGRCRKAQGPRGAHARQRPAPALLGHSRPRAGMACAL